VIFGLGIFFMAAGAAGLFVMLHLHGTDKEAYDRLWAVGLVSIVLVGVGAWMSHILKWLEGGP